MSDELDRLWALHGLDEQAAVVQVRRRQRPQERAELERRVTAERVALDSQRTRSTEGQKRRRELEKDIEALGAEERKFQSQLATVKKNEEYQALLHEIDNVHRRRSDLETEVLTRMEAEDSLAAGRPALEKSLAAAERECADRVARLQADEAADAARLAELDAARQSHFAGLPAATRSRYERVHGLREGRAVVSAAKGACGGCFRSLPPQLMQEARRRDRVLTCEGCGRMLVWPPDAD